MRLEQKNLNKNILAKASKKPQLLSTSMCTWVRTSGGHVVVWDGVTLRVWW